MNLQTNTLSAFLDTWKKQEPDALPPNGDIIQQAINDLQSFSQEFEAYFEDVITNKYYDPEKTTDMRLRYQYNQTLQAYWLSLEQVLIQWQVGYYKEILQQAYEQSSYYLKNLTVAPPGILIYFNKVANIQYLPYTRIPILGIPYLFSGPEKWSAIPHEIGHYVYWNLGNTLSETRQHQKELQAETEQFLKDQGIDERQQKFVLPWFEEIFCDIIGTHIDDSGFPSSSDEFIKSRAGNEQDLTFNDGHHPPLCIRPFIWDQALKSKKKNVDLQTRDKIFDQITTKDVKTLKIKTSALMINNEGNLPAPGRTINDKQFDTFSMGELLPTMGILVDYISKKSEKILGDFHPAKESESSFQEMKKFVESEQQTSDKIKRQETYELLLKTRILEEGYEHYHGIQTWHGWHEATTHSH